MTGGSDRMTQVSVRKMTEDDIDGVLAIDKKIVGRDRAATYSSLPGSFVGGELDLSVVAEADGRLIGFLLGRVTELGYEEADCFLLELIGVDPDYRRVGIGRKLVEAFEDRCRQRGAQAIRVMVSWHDWWLLSFLRSLEFGRGEMAEFVKQLER